MELKRREANRLAKRLNHVVSHQELLLDIARNYGERLLELLTAEDREKIKRALHVGCFWEPTDLHVSIFLDSELNDYMEAAGVDWPPKDIEPRYLQ